MPAKLLPQSVALNVAVGALLASIIFLPTWQAVVALVAVLAALCFRWTQEPTGPAMDLKKVAVLEDEVRTLTARVKNLGFKVGIKEM